MNIQSDQKRNKFYLLDLNHTVRTASSALFLILGVSSMVQCVSSDLRIFCVNSKSKPIKPWFYLWCQNPKVFGLINERNSSAFYIFNKKPLLK